MSPNNNACFGDQMVTIWVGPLADKEKFTIHKNALNTNGETLLRIMDSLPPQETDPVTSVPTYLLVEQPETFRTFLQWLYAAYIGATFSSLQLSNLALFRLYAFAYKHCFNILEDAVVSVLYEKFANDDTLWLSLGSDKPALEALLKEIPPDTNLYSLVIRSLAYSMRLRAEHKSSSDGGAWGGGSWGFLGEPSRPATATADQVKEVMNCVPSELWGPVSREILLALTLNHPTHSFASTVGHESKFLKLREDHDDDEGGGGFSSGWQLPNVPGSRGP